MNNKYLLKAKANNACLGALHAVKTARVYWSAVGAASGAVMALTTAVASTGDLSGRITELLTNVYGAILGISTILAVTIAAVALILRMVSKNSRTVETCDDWLKRVIITWVILNSLGLIVSFIAPLVTNGDFGSLNRSSGDVETTTVTD